MKDSIFNKMRKKGLKITPQRIAIIEVLTEKTPLHPSARLIYREARKRNKSLSLSTVYAALHELSKHGIIKVLEFDKRENRFEANITQHINLICNECNRIIDLRLPVSIDPKEIVKKVHFWVTDTRLEYYGYCQQCKGK